MSMTQLKMGMEGLVDKFTIEAVIRALEEVCRLKEAHLAENWQDMSTSRRWRYVAEHLGRAIPFASGL